LKQIILTIDYEIFLGEQTGSVQSCMIQPTQKLSEYLSLNNSKMTVFWDILHFYKLLELENKFPKLKNDRIAIQNQIISLAKNGHDIQLHLHPHWLDAKYTEGSWKFTYNRFKLHSLSKTNDRKDINTILGCITISKNLVEKIVGDVDKNFKVFCFRAGGYLIEPFDIIKKALFENNIYIDSSVCPELENDGNIFSYNFKKYPNDTVYRFEKNISKIDKDGKFVEIPIYSIRVPFLIRLYFLLLKRIKYKSIESVKKGSGSSNSKGKKKSRFQKVKFFLTSKKFQKLTTDNSFKEKYNYILKRAKNNSTQILHPKMLNEHMLNVLNSKLSKNEVKFISIREFVLQQKITQKQVK